MPTPVSSYSSSFTTGASSVSGIITSISLGGISTAEIDITGLTDTAKSYIMGTKDGGTVEVSVIVDSSAVPDLPTSGATSATSFALRFGASGPTFTFSAFIQQCSVEASVDGAVTASYTLRISGDITVS